MFGQSTSQTGHSVTQTAVRAKTTTAPAGAQRHCSPPAFPVPFTETTTGAPSRGSVAAIRPPRPAMTGMPGASIAHIAHTAGKPSSSTCWRVGEPENG